MSEEERNSLKRKACALARKNLSAHVGMLEAVATALEQDRMLDRAAFERIAEKYRRRTGDEGAVR